MKLFTVATHNHGYYNALIKSAKRNGFKLINLGKKQKWKGLIWKFKLMLKSIEKINNKEVIAFCDGFDVMVVKNATELEIFFKSLNCDIIFGNENSNVNPLINFLNYYTFRYHHLLHNREKPNTGVYVGYAGKIKKFLSICLKEVENLKDDQDIGYKIFYYQKKFNLKLKTVNEHIYTVPFPKTLVGLLNYNTINKIECDLNKSFFIHGNGNRNIDIYSKKLLLPPKINNQTSHNHVLHYSKKLIDNNKRTIVLILIVIYLSNQK